eukprot:323149-Chlamydomonas_euryale.AAC.1
MPLVELAAVDVRVCLGTDAPGITRGVVFLSSAVNSYNEELAEWEPVLEPWLVLLHLDASARSRTTNGVAPGTWLRLTSTQGEVQVWMGNSTPGKGG